LLIRGEKTKARPHFEWIKAHGKTTFLEYTIAWFELERIEESELRSGGAARR
jgi:hypothetical protein